MKVLVLGATRGTGEYVVEPAMAKGHEVTVLVRGIGRYIRPGVRVIEGDARNAMDVLRAVDGQDAVVQCIGEKIPWLPQTLESVAMRNIVAAMKKTGARRLLVVSAMGVGKSMNQTPWWYRWFEAPTFLRGVIADKNIMEPIVQGSGLDWVIARAPILTNSGPTGRVKVLGKGEVGTKITRVDLAVWLVEQLESRTYVGQAVVMVNN